MLAQKRSLEYLLDSLLFTELAVVLGWADTGLDLGPGKPVTSILTDDGLV